MFSDKQDKKNYFTTKDGRFVDFSGNDLGNTFSDKYLEKITISQSKIGPEIRFHFVDINEKGSEKTEYILSLPYTKGAELIKYIEYDRDILDSLVLKSYTATITEGRWKGRDYYGVYVSSMTKIDREKAREAFKSKEDEDPNYLTKMVESALKFYSFESSESEDIFADELPSNKIDTEEDDKAKDELPKQSKSKTVSKTATPKKTSNK